MSRLICCLALLLVGCPAAGVRGSTTVKTAKAADVASCDMLGIVEERSETAYEIDDHRESVIKSATAKAKALGATHVVWIQVEADKIYGLAKGEAYRCDAN